MVEKMLPPNGQSATALAAETGLPQPTLSRWLHRARTVGVMKVKRWSLVEKLRVVIEASRLEDAKLGEFLRREGLHETQLTQWRAELETALEEAPPRSRGKSAEAYRIKELERELRRKEKALAETAALLVLKKKAAAIWGEEEDDTSDENE